MIAAIMRRERQYRPSDDRTRSYLLNVERFSFWRPIDRVFEIAAERDASFKESGYVP
jgi:hypothetical protein